MYPIYVRGQAYLLAHDGSAALFALWKDADLDVPILKESKTEYAKLQ